MFSPSLKDKNAFFSIAFAENKCTLLSLSEFGIRTDLLLHRDG
jgi:hypothetical protein